MAKNLKNCVHFVLCDFVQLSPACGPNTYQKLPNNVWTDFRLYNGYLKYPIGKSIFAVILPLKLLRAAVANANTNSLHTLFDTYMDNILEEFVPNRMVRNVQNLSFWTKN